MRFSVVLMTSAVLGGILFCTTGAAQDTQAKYQRKSISYVDAVLPIGRNVRLTPEQERFLLRAVKSEVEMSRFDYNPLPEKIVDSFKRELKVRGVSDLEGVSEVMNQVLVPEILRIVDMQKEIRAQGLVSEAERHSFVVEKAKETGITAEDLEAVMNAAYIYLPVVSKVEIERNKKKNSASASIEGGIIWFQVKTEGDRTAVELLVKKPASGSGFAKLDGKFSFEGRKLNGAQYAFVTAAKTFARNLKVATQEIPEFQLTNPLTDTGPGWVKFPMGKKEGLGVDDKFIIAEFYEEPDGSLTRKELGMVRVSKVADNREKRADSKARVVIGGGYERGMLALEHPRLPIDLSVRFAALPVAMNIPVTDENYTGNIYAGQLWFQYNLARSTQISQFFVSLYGEFGGGKIQDLQFYEGQDLPAGLYFGAGIGLTKKFYVNRFHLGLEALASWGRYRLKEDIPEEFSYLGEREEWIINSVGLTFNGNIEIALGYDVNLGGGVSYRAFAPNDNWTYKIDDSEVDLSDFDLPELDFSGAGFQVYLTWSLPSLSYDPLAAARGAIGY